jgi:superoxide dismutase, Fe-Mn family
MIEMKKLPYAHDALEPHISKETLHYHYNKHYKSYVDNLNKLIKDTEFEGMKLGHIIQKSGSGPIFNNAAQIWNHEFYFDSMMPEKKMLDEESRLGKAIIKEWKTVEAFEKEFTEKAKKLFGSGWVCSQRRMVMLELKLPIMQMVQKIHLFLYVMFGSMPTTSM